MTYLLPNLSMIKTVTVEPIAFMAANGILSIIAYFSFSSIPSIVVPESIIISGP